MPVYAKDFKEDVLEIIKNSSPRGVSATELRGNYPSAYQMNLDYNLYDKLKKAANMLVKDGKVKITRGRYKIK